MNTHAGYSKRTITDTNVLLAGGGDKSLADFIGGIQYVSASHKILIKTAETSASWVDLVTLVTTDENVKLTPKTDNVNRPIMMINGGTGTGTQTSTSLFSVDIYANAKTGNVSAKTLESTIAQGTSPLKVVSTTLVDNLNVDLLDGYHAVDNTSLGIIKEGFLTTPDDRSVSNWVPAWYRIGTITGNNTWRNSLLLHISCLAPNAEKSILLQIFAYSYTSSDNGIKAYKIFGNIPGSDIRIYYNHPGSMELWIKNQGKFDGVIVTRVLSEHRRSKYFAKDVISLEKITSSANLITSSTLNPDSNATNYVTVTDNTSTNPGVANRIAYYNDVNNIVSGNIETDGSYLHITATTDVGGTKVDTSAPLTVGSLTGTHLAIDGNEILAKTNDITPGVLYLQDTTGTVQVCGTGGLKVFDINIATNATTDIAKRTIGSTSTLYLDSASGTSLIFSKAGTEMARFNTSGNFVPSDTNTRNLGSSNLRWANIYSVLGNFSGLITSSLATGTSPFNVISTTLNANLNSDLLDNLQGAWYMKRGAAYTSASTGEYWLKVAICTIDSTGTHDTSITLIVSEYYSRNGSGILVLNGRKDSGSTSIGSKTKAYWVCRDNLVNPSEFVLTAKVESSNKTIFSLYKKQSSSYKVSRFTMVDEGKWYGKLDLWELLTADVSNNCYSTIPSDETQFVSVDYSVASQLSTSHTFWGQSYDGTNDVSGNMTGVGSIAASGSIVINKSNVDFTLSNNGVSSVTYPGFFIRDTNGKQTGRVFTTVSTNGDLTTYLYSSNYKTDGSSAGEMYIGEKITKDGSKTWLISDVSAFRTALGLGTHATDSTPYLPLAGGTMIGNITFDTGTTTEKIIRFDVNRNSSSFNDGWATSSLVWRDASDSTFFQLGVYGTSNTFNYAYIGTEGYNSNANLRVYSDKILYGNKLIAHAGNITNNSATIGTDLTTIATIAGVDIKAKIDPLKLKNIVMASGDDYDTLSNYNAARGSFIAINSNSVAASDMTLNGMDNIYVTLASFGQGNRTIQFMGFGWSDTLKYRHVGGSSPYSLTEWKTIAFTDSNVASASKLSGTGTYSAWGLTYWSNGVPSSIDGNMTSVGNITMSGNIYMALDKYIYTKISSTNRGMLGTWSSYSAVWLGYYTAHDSGYNTFIYGNDIKLYYGTSTTLGFILNSSGNVGIGTTSPSQKLHVNGSTRIDGSIEMPRNGGAIKFYLDSTNGYTTAIRVFTSSSTLSLGYETTLASFNTNIYGNTISLLYKNSSGTITNGLNIDTAGNIGIGTTSQSYKLHVKGDAAATNFYTTSDRNKKTNISNFSEHIRKFQLKDTEKWHYGVIAQEVEEMFRDGEEGNMTVNYNSILSFYIGLLENRVKMLEDKLKKYEEIQNI